MIVHLNAMPWLLDSQET